MPIRLKDLPLDVQQRVLSSLPPSERPRRRGTFSNAQPTTSGGIQFPSKMEARVYARLLGELLPGQRLFRQVRFPLLSLAGHPRTHVPLYVTIDFVIVEGVRIFRLIDAKCRRRSREWVRGKRAVEASLGLRVEEVSA
jgi:hypothetical protein